MDNNNTKPTNPKDAIGVTKTPNSTLSPQVICEVGVGMLEGSCKYGRHNYREAGVRACVYYDATMRHLMQWYEGEDLDPDSGLSHVTKAICSLMVLRDSMLQGNWVDDRPPKAANPDWLRELNAKTAEILKKYPNPVTPYTEVGVRQDQSVAKAMEGLSASMRDECYKDTSDCAKPPEGFSEVSPGLYVANEPTSVFMKRKPCTQCKTQMGWNEEGGLCWSCVDYNKNKENK